MLNISDTLQIWESLVSKCIGIERTQLRPHRSDFDRAYLSGKGYVLAAPGLSSRERKQSKNATYEIDLDKVADLIEKEGFYIRMGKAPDRPSMIQPSKVRIIRA